MLALMIAEYRSFTLRVDFVESAETQQESFEPYTPNLE